LNYGREKRLLSRRKKAIMGYTKIFNYGGYDMKLGLVKNAGEIIAQGTMLPKENDSEY